MVFLGTIDLEYEYEIIKAEKDISTLKKQKCVVPLIFCNCHRLQLLRIPKLNIVTSHLTQNIEIAIMCIM